MSSFNPPEIRYQYLNSLGITSEELHEQHRLASALIDSLDKGTLTSIRNAFLDSTRTSNAGELFINIDKINILLRTGNSGAEHSMIRNGYGRLVSPTRSHTINGDRCISGFDFKALIEARIHISSRRNQRQNLYLRYVHQLVEYLIYHPTLRDYHNLYADEVERYRPQLKKSRIEHYKITQCEFTGEYIDNNAKVEFAHIDSVVTNPHKAISIDNGVIILKNIHSDMTRKHIHTFEDMLDYCIENNYSILWADNYVR
ncbi:hypothetical protein DYC15_08225 [Vibrio cholerae]|uniref:hypothetical protein n=1 Tax=Vibrio ordalii TaxID=28174 RepID=UPI002089E40F|nr:hypothetical protein [Vibrio ordalii]EGR2507677.1 hypothetical protein [Vibrio cholerae]EIO4085883.1 hypothetical protein [Vibrio parahaemolyticus]HDY8177741.1 hypothetical protein [Vibrio vulnificus]EKR8727478.1 hypothetical protein [Vibrio cholerae]ELD6109742.1 hypothetical protein [Vibrio cholerae]